MYQVLLSHESSDLAIQMDQQIGGASPALGGRKFPLFSLSFHTKDPKLWNDKEILPHGRKWPPYFTTQVRSNRQYKLPPTMTPS